MPYIRNVIFITHVSNHHTYVAIREVTGVTVFCGPAKLINQLWCNAIWNVRTHKLHNYVCVCVNIMIVCKSLSCVYIRTYVVSSYSYNNTKSQHQYID